VLCRKRVCVQKPIEESMLALVCQSAQQERTIALSRQRRRAACTKAVEQRAELAGGRVHASGL